MNLYYGDLQVKIQNCILGSALSTYNRIIHLSAIILRFLLSKWHIWEGCIIKIVTEHEEPWLAIRRSKNKAKHAMRNAISYLLWLCTSAALTPQLKQHSPSNMETALW